MEKSFALVLPDRSGALRDVTRMLSVLGVSVLRASYNRVVDVHTFFLDVSGTSAAIARAEDAKTRWQKHATLKSIFAD